MQDKLYHPPRQVVSANRLAIYQFSDGTLMRNYRGTTLRRCDEKGRIIPRVRMSKKDRRALKLLAAAQRGEVVP